MPTSIKSCLAALAFGSGVLLAAEDRNQAEPAWGQPVDGIRAGLVAEKTRFASGDQDPIRIVLHLRNDSEKEVELVSGGSIHGWGWEFQLAGGGAPFVPRWDDDTGGCCPPPQPIALKPGTTHRVESGFRQRSFTKWGFGISSLVPGKYKVVAKLTEWQPGSAYQKIAREITTGTVEIEIGPRDNDWDKVPTADAVTLVGLLGDKEDLFLRHTAAAFLLEMGKKAAPALIDGLQNGNFWSRPKCAQILGALRKDADPVVIGALTNALGDKEESVAIEAANSLGPLYDAAKSAIPALIAAARNRDLPKLRLAAVNALGFIGDARPEVVATLVELLGDSSIEYTAAAYANARLGSKARNAVPALLDEVRKKESPNRGYALYALQCMGPAAAPAVPTAMHILEDENEDPGIRYKAMNVLANSAEKSALPALERVRDRHRGDSRDDPATKAFLTGIDTSITRMKDKSAEPQGKP